MGLEPVGVLEEPKAAPLARPVLDLDGMLARSDISGLPESKAPVAKVHLSRTGWQARHEEAPRFELDQRPLRFGRRLVRKENEKKPVAQIQHLETAGCHLKVEASLLSRLNIGKSPG